MNKIVKFVFLIVVFFVINSCSTKKDTFVSRNYHKMTAHYNAWFNGNESLKEGVLQLEKIQKDNYLKILPVFRYGSEQDAQSCSANWDRAITKGSKVIKLHSMVIKKTERNRWINESYMLIGKGNFYKKNYMTAKQTFEYVISHYKKSPVSYQASLWLAKTYNQMHQFEKAQPQLDLVKEKLEKSGKTKINIFDKLEAPFVKRDIPLSVYRDLPLLYADYDIQMENYTPATIDHIKKAIKANHRKKVRVRPEFILAQIYQFRGELNKATKLYHKVIRMNPKYEMAFNCKMNLAKCYDATSKDSYKIKKMLVKMSKDARNKDYLDQIYFALAEIALKENNMKEAMKYLKLSSASSKNNANQKAITLLKIASIYFDMPDFIKSASYYDTTMTVLPKDYPNYAAIDDKRNVLDKLAANLIIIRNEDSLQRIAAMSEKDRNAFIDKIIKDYLAAEQAKKLAAANQKLAGTNAGVGQGANSNWYFYNQNTVKFGISDFIKKWGNRPLEDNWRLSNKKQIDETTDSTLTHADSLKRDSIKAAAKAFNPKDRKTYLKNLPLTAEKLKASNEKVEEAYYAAAFIFKEGLQDYKHSVEEFEALAKRFPDSKHLPSSYYQLYREYSDELHNQEKADYYKNLLVTKFPDTDFAKLVMDPNYAKRMAEVKNEAADLYKNTYQAYLDSQYPTVIENTNKALMAFHGNDLLPKFEFLKALSIGKTSDIASFKAALNDVVTKYPASKVKPEAMNILTYIDNKDKKPEDKKDAKNANQTQLFTIDTNAIHLYVMVIEVKSVNIKDIKVAISNFDKDQFSNVKLDISGNFISNDKQMVIVSNFENQTSGMHYFKTIKDNPDMIKVMNKSKYQQFIISTTNYTTLLKNKEFNKYYKFFKDNYLK